MNSWKLAEAFWACSVHALSTEAEEVMGLLLGDVLVGASFDHGFLNAFYVRTREIGATMDSVVSLSHF